MEIDVGTEEDEEEERHDGETEEGREVGEEELIDEDGLEEEDKRMLERLKEILGKEEKGKLFNLKYVDRGNVRSDCKSKQHRELHCPQR